MLKTMRILIKNLWENRLGTASKPNRRLTGGSVRFWPVSIVLNNDNRPEPDETAGQPAVGFWSRPLINFAVIVSNILDNLTSKQRFATFSSYLI